MAWCRSASPSYGGAETHPAIPYKAVGVTNNRTWLTSWRRRIHQGLRWIGRRLSPSPAGYTGVYPSAELAPWINDAAFVQAYRKIRDYTLLDVYRCYELWQLVSQTVLVQGALLEVGTWRGGSGALIAISAMTHGINDRIYLADTFRGVVNSGPHDGSYSGGEHSDASLSAVEELLRSRLCLTDVTVLKGVFPEQVEQFVVDTAFRFCHIDVDVYESARAVAEWIWPRLQKGGLIVYDDYGFAHCEGVTHWVDEQRSRPGRVTIHNLNGHAIVIKTE